MMQYLARWSLGHPIASTIIGLYLFYLAYIIIMGVYRAYLAKRLTIYMKVLLGPIIVIGGVMDVVANITVATLLCVQLPQEWFVTQRFERYTKWDPTKIAGLNLWRYNFATFVCNNLLDVFDPDGNHCENLNPATAAVQPAPPGK